MPGASDVIARVQSAWHPLRDAVARLERDGLRSTTPAGWSVQEMCAHIAFWDEAVEGAVRGLFRGEPTAGYAFGSGYTAGDEWPSADVHNAREAAWARAQDGEAVIARLVRAHEAMLAFLATVHDDEIAQHETYFMGLGSHYLEHERELEALLEPRSNRPPAMNI